MKKNRVIRYYLKKYWKEEILCGLLFIVFIFISLAGPKLMQYFIDIILPNKNIYSVIRFAIIFLSMYLILAVLSILIKYIIVNMENKIITDVREKMFTNLVYQPLEYYWNNRMGIAMERILRDTEVVRSLWGFLFPSSFSSILTFTLTFTIIFLENYVIALIALITIVAYVIIFKVYNEKLKNLYLRTRKDIDEINLCITDTWSGVKEIKIFQYEPEIINKFSNLLSILKRDNTNMAIKNEFSKQLLGLSTIIGNLITLIVGGYFVIKGKMTVGVLIALQSYVSKLYSPAQDIADMGVDYKKYTVNIERISELLFLDKEEFRIDENFSDIELKTGNINFENVSFSYGKNEILRNVSFSMNNKGIVAIVGKSGAGKSTLLNLLLGFIKPKSGKIEIGGYDISSIPLNVLRKNISFVSQDTYLLNMSIYDNIKIGNLDAKEEEIENVISLLEIDKIVENYPNKLNTIVSEFGKNLSGGQIQRISIARALLKKSPIIIFDEATSSIDSQTERLIHDLLINKKDEALVILISHRLSSLKCVDQIFLLNNGEIAEAGTLDELNKEGGLFATLFEEQLSVG